MLVCSVCVCWNISLFSHLDVAHTRCIVIMCCVLTLDTNTTLANIYNIFFFKPGNKRKELEECVGYETDSSLFNIHQMVHWRCWSSSSWRWWWLVSVLRMQLCCVLCASLCLVRHCKTPTTFSLIPPLSLNLPPIIVSLRNMYTHTQFIDKHIRLS